MSGADAGTQAFLDQVWLIRIGWEGGSAWFRSATEPVLDGNDLDWTPVDDEHVARVDFSLCHFIHWRLEKPPAAKRSSSKLPTADVMAAIEHVPGMTWAKLARMVGGKQLPIKEAVTRLIDEGVVRCETKRGVNRFWPAAIERSSEDEQHQQPDPPSWVED